MSYLPFRDVQLKAMERLRAYTEHCGGAKAFPIDIEHMIEAFEGVPIVYKDERQMGWGVLGHYDLAESEIGIVDVKSLEGRVRFTLAHEYAHHVLHRPYYEEYTARMEAKGQSAQHLRLLDRPSHPRSSWIEQQANIFAAECLMPARLVLRFLHREKALGDHKELYARALAHEANVSLDAARIRLGLSRGRRT